MKINIKMKSVVKRETINGCIILLLIMVMSFSSAQNSAKMKWSVGEVSVDCESKQICYPIMIQSNEDKTLLSYTTLRMFYDSEVIGNLQITNKENGYQIGLVMETFPTIGDEFGFQTDKGGFPRISLAPNKSNYLQVQKNRPTHVFDLCFTINESPIPDKLYAPLIFDNTHTSKEKGIKNDTGYFEGDAGIATQYLIEGIDFIFEADDEADHFNWIGDLNFEGKLNKQGQAVGRKSKSQFVKTSCDYIPMEDIYTLDGVDIVFEAYPNPFRTNVNLNYNIPFDTDVSIQVYTLSGFLLKSHENKAYEKNTEAS
ncbi:hypothetical protein, partial [Snuella lapsa]|uniref:hypothetical protein n=1 Tax=Snuella lapsa TaxID=870481 RepID=UPI0031EA2CB3